MSVPASAGNGFPPDLLKSSGNSEKGQKSKLALSIQPSLCFGIAPLGVKTPDWVWGPLELLCGEKTTLGGATDEHKFTILLKVDGQVGSLAYFPLY